MTGRQTERAVFDCNIYFQALISPHGPSGRCVKAAVAEEFILIASPHAMSEFVRVAGQESLRARFGYSDERIEALRTSVEQVAVLIDEPPRVFTLTRDPDDAHYIDLAIAARALYVVSRDRDLLDLMKPGVVGSGELAKAYPALRIMDPVAFLQLMQG